MSDNLRFDVAIIDDDPILLDALKDSVESIGVKVATFDNPTDCIAALKAGGCGLLITDVNMPEMNGIELVRQVKAIQPYIPVIVMTGFADIALAVRAIKAGAKEFVEKPLDEDTFLPLVQASINNDLIREAQLSLELTSSELEVLKLVALGKCNKEIAYQLEKSIRTVENQRQRLSKKLKAGSTAELTKIAVKLGLVEL